MTFAAEKGRVVLDSYNCKLCFGEGSDPGKGVTDHNACCFVVLKEARRRYVGS